MRITILSIYKIQPLKAAEATSETIEACLASPINAALKYHGNICILIESND